MPRKVYNASAGGLEGYSMHTHYIGVSAPSLHRESTDSLIGIRQWRSQDIFCGRA